MTKRSLLLASSSLGLLLAIPGHAAAAPSNPFDPPLRDLVPTAAVVDAPDFIPGEIVVDVKDDLSDAEIEALGRELHVSLRDNSPGVKDDGNIEIADVAPGEMAAVMARLAADPRVEGVEPAAVAQMYWAPNDPKYSEQWHMTRAGAETAWEYACGQGVTVAVVDTGVACYDEGGFMKGTDLAGTTCVGGYNFVGKNEIAADDQGHGTHVAGTIAQTTNNGIGVAGLAHCAKLMPVKVLSARGWGTMADVAEGIRWAADHGAQVINLSLGSSQKSPVVEKAVTHAYKKGVIVVAAAGNSGRSVGYPAGYPGVIAVSATDKNDNIAWFSSRGPEVAIGAPGVGVTQQTICESGKNKCEVWGTFNGTSMASPHVAGAAALLVGQGVTDPDAVKATLQGTATPKEDKNLFGAGILEAGKATQKTHWAHVVIRLAALAAIAAVVVRRIKQKGGKLEKGSGKVAGALLGSVGLLPFLPLVGIPARIGGARVFAELAMKPLGEWTLLLSPAIHKWLPLASALPVFALTALMFGNKHLRPVIGGLALGTAALCAQIGISGETWFAMGPFMLRVWCAVNVVLCMALARLALDAKKA
ncbi:MAG: peptidase S8 [Labilithrix sp.]|nr:peptidase S8 [Labilithrix sp.]MCW5814669.1 peptidase S8 [Labilithrix sp.]